MKLYAIRNWTEHYETHETKKLKRLNWLPTPNKHDGRGFRRLMRLPDGPAMYGIWILIAQVASKMPVRGVLQDEDGPLSPDDLADKTGAPGDLFAKTLAVLSSSEHKIRWVDVTETGENLPLPPDAAGTSPAPRQRREGKGREGKEGKEGKEGENETEQPPPAALPEPPEPEGDCLDADDPAQKPAPVNLDMTAITTIMAQIKAKSKGEITPAQARQWAVDHLEHYGAEKISETIAGMARLDKPWEIDKILKGPAPNSEAAQFLTAEKERQHYAAKQREIDKRKREEEERNKATPEQRTVSIRAALEAATRARISTAATAAGGR